MKKNSKLKTQAPSVFDVDYISKLANLPLTDREKVLFSEQLSDVLSYISKLNEIVTNKVDPIAHIVDLTNITRDDETFPSLSQDEALKNAPKTYNGFFEVDAVFEEQ